MRVINIMEVHSESDLMSARASTFSCYV